MLLLKRSDLLSVFEHCSEGYPNEACGILGGKGGAVEKVYRMKNAKPGPSYYEMDPQEQFRVMRDIRQAGLALVGVFHSHPAGPAYPSSVDVARAYWPGTSLPNYPEAVYVIVSLRDPARPSARAFSIESGTVAEVRLNTVEDPGRSAELPQSGGNEII
jgi:[CysO sulfur-carrier protein]-S-L-cysteine hydrolase